MCILFFFLIESIFKIDKENNLIIFLTCVFKDTFKMCLLLLGDFCLIQRLCSNDVIRGCKEKWVIAIFYVADKVTSVDPRPLVFYSF